MGSKTGGCREATFAYFPSAWVGATLLGILRGLGLEIDDLNGPWEGEALQEGKGSPEPVSLFHLGKSPDPVYIFNLSVR